YGFIEEYPMAMAYRDDRINQIWEGTNEINKAIITGYMMKKVLMEEISLRNFLKDLDDFIDADFDDTSDDPLTIEKHGLEAAKKLSVLIFQEALCEFGQDLKHEQQLGEALADIFTLIFTAGSVISRVQQTLSSNGTSNMSLIIAKINTAESLLEIKLVTNICLNRIFKGTIPSGINTSIQSLKTMMTLNTDTISLKQTLADYMYEQKEYPF
ncbi:MAG: acyl-CoA dehydrogenase family protein, partial [Candidatus Neomarinimicrobiota bacterium]|nr:acyl-CoA dehydrogenase family protein [Candidatus Neomarinimicrobiota bacterium]